MPTLPGLVELVEGLRHGRIDLLAYLDRLEQHFETTEPQIHAFEPEEARFDRLREEARRLVAAYPPGPAGEPTRRPALFGVPVGVKDIFRVDGFPTRAGTWMPEGELAGAEAECVGALRAAGVLILGKTATTELAYFAPTATRNPHRTNHTPGGSSSGSAAAVAAELAPLTLGSQTIGSISRPAAYCGVVGFKPSYDRISRAGVVPLAPSLDHVGLFTADVAGSRLAASVLCRGFNAQAADRRPVLGVPEGPYLERASAEGRTHFDALCARLADAGYTVKRASLFSDFAAVEVRHHLIVAAEAARAHGERIDRHREIWHAQTAALIARGRDVADEELERALRGREQLRSELAARHAEHGVDLWISPPATGPAPAGIDSTGDPVMNLPWSHAGVPTLAVPAGRAASQMPLGLQLAARWYEDEALLAWGEEIAAVVAS